MWSKDSDKPAERQRGEREKPSTSFVQVCHTAFVCCLSEAYCSLLGCFVTIAYFSISASKSWALPLCSHNPPSDSLTGPRTWLQRALRALVFFQQPHPSKRYRTPPFKDQQQRTYWGIVSMMSLDCHWNTPGDIKPWKNSKEIIKNIKIIKEVSKAASVWGICCLHGGVPLTWTLSVWRTV